MSNDNTTGQKDPERDDGIEMIQSAGHLWIQEQNAVDVWIAAKPGDVADLEAMR
jgi:hypothetical protein